MLSLFGLIKKIKGRGFGLSPLLNLKGLKEMDGMKMFRVYNKCSFDIGITLTSGQQPIIRKGSFLPMSVNDILYLESIASGDRKPFSSRMLVAVSDDGKDLTLEDLGGYTDTYSERHFDKEEISANLKKPAKQLEKWLEGITDPVEIHGILEVAQDLDLPNSKMKILHDKAPNADLFDN